MKKRIAIVMAALLAVASMSTVSFAEEAGSKEATEESGTINLNWSDVKDYVDVLGLEGDFVTFDEVGVQIWLPDILKEVELTDEDKEAGFIGYFETGDDAEEKAAVSVVYVDLDGMELSKYTDELDGMEGVSDIMMGSVNGLPCVSYEMEDQDSGSLTFMTEAGYGLEVTCTPVSGEQAQTMLAFILSSIMPEGEAETEAE